MPRVFLTTFPDKSVGICRQNYFKRRRPLHDGIMGFKLLDDGVIVWARDDNGQFVSIEGENVRRTESDILIGGVSIFQWTAEDVEENNWAKHTFEVSRMNGPDNKALDSNVRFNPAIHTIEALARGVPGHVPVTTRLLDQSLLPYHAFGCEDHKAMCFEPDCHDRYFRDALEDDGVGVVVNMDKARAVHLGRIRAIRNEELVKESGAKYRQPPEIEGLFTPERQVLLQALRDIPTTLDLAVATPEQLKAVWPTEFPRPTRDY